MEDRTDQTESLENEDVEAHKKHRGESVEAPAEPGSIDSDDDVEAHKKHR